MSRVLGFQCYDRCIAGLVAAVLYVSWNLWSKYANWPTYMKTEIVEQMRADFPAVTVCKLDPCGRPDGQARNCTAHHVASDIINYQYTRFFYAKNDGQHSIFVKGEHMIRENYIQRKETGFEHCFTHLPTQYQLSKLGIYYYRIVLRADAEVIVHKRDQFTEAVSDGRYGGLKVLDGQRIEAQVSWKDVRTLDRPLNIRRNVRSCSNQDYDRCKSGEGEGGMEGSRCPIPCSFLITHIGARNFIPWMRPNDTRRLYFYFARMTVIEREKQLYEFVEFIGEWGGYVEVLIGGSILDIVLLLNRIINRKIKAIEDKALESRRRIPLTRINAGESGQMAPPASRRDWRKQWRDGGRIGGGGGNGAVVGGGEEERADRSLPPSSARRLNRL